MRVILLWAALLAASGSFTCGPTIALAAPPSAATATEPEGKGEGNYGAKKLGMTVHLIIVALGDQAYAGHLVAFGPAGRCIDSWAGLGKWSDISKLVGLTLFEYLVDKKNPKETKKEQVFLTYNSVRNTYLVKESEEVSHGAGCTFEIGELSRER